MSLIFGSTPATSSSSQPSLFANLGATASSSQPAPSLFSSLNSSQPQQTSRPFSNLGATSQATSQPSLFSNISAKPAASQPQQGGSLFSNAGAASQSIFGSTQPAAANTQGTQQQNVQPGPISDSTTYSAYFTGLLEKNKKHDRPVDDGPGFGEIPSLQLGLGDIAKRVRALGGTGVQASGSKGADSNTCVEYQCIYKITVTK
jgi:nuclear pore complex protein Nup93